MIDKKILMEILKSREDREIKQKEIIHKYKNSIISFTLNIPGPNKDSIKYRKIHDVGMRTIINNLKDKGYKIDYIENIYKITGPEGYISLYINPIELKGITTTIEETHKLGRLFDMDVFDFNHNQISRRILGYNPRKCLLCDKDAKVCSRSSSHSLEELIYKVNQIYYSYFSGQ